LKLVDVRPAQIFYRYLTPKWAFVPTSGAGAAVDGGRFNRPGVEALYLARSPHTALEEYKQGSSIAPPATLAAYHVDVGDVVDFSAGYDPAVWTADWADWDCDWKYISRIRIEKRTPASWMLADAVIAAGHAGILFPSTRHIGGVNLVLYPANQKNGDWVQVHDPDDALPQDQSSWPTR
jgi:RES domain-containing protein